MTADSEPLYYRTNHSSDELGPIGQQELEQLLSQGTLTRQTEVRREGSAVWIRLSRFLNVSDATLPDGNRPNVSDQAHLLDEFVIDSGAPQAPAPRRQERWYCRILGKEVGPIEVPILRQMAEEGQISPTDRVRRDGEATWVLADSIPGIFEGVAASKAADLSSAASSAISPQRFSPFVPKPKPAPAESPARAGTASTPSKPPTSASPAASSEAAGPRPSTAEPAPLSPRPASVTSSAPVTPSAPHTSLTGSSVSNSAYASLRKPPYPPPVKHASSRDWSFSFPDLSDSPIVPVTVGIVLLVGLGWLAYATGFASTGFNQVAGWFDGDDTLVSPKKDKLADDPNF